MLSKPLALPLEILKDILGLAFLPTDPDSLTPAPLPPRSTSHLLLVSRGVRELCLPFFWRAVTIAQSNDWVTLFDSEAGLLVKGEEGRTRWGWVEELNIGLEARVPLSLEPLDLFADQNPQVLHALTLPTARRIPRVIFHHTYPHEDEAKQQAWKDALVEDEQTLGQLGMLLLPSMRAQYESRPVSSSPFSRSAGPQRERVQRLLADFWDDFEHTLSGAYSEHILRILRSFRPKLLSFAARQVFRAIGWLPEDLDEPDVLEITCYNDEALEEANLTWMVHGVWPKARCRLLKFSQGALDDNEAMVRDFLASDSPTQLASSWTWTREDGSTALFDFGTLPRK